MYLICVFAVIIHALTAVAFIPSVRTVRYTITDLITWYTTPAASNMIRITFYSDKQL